ncbi:MAG: M48 family metallopeptidase [Nitrospirota bacterium]|nr:M48 family metallopeptidase [Nitrospirota bacterium]
MIFSGRFCDGRTAMVHPVRVEVTRITLDICSPEGDRLASWRLNGIVPPEPVMPGDPLTVRHPDHPDAVLTVADPDFDTALKEAAPEVLGDRARAERKARTAWRGIGAVASVLLVLAAAVLWLPQILVRHIPPNWEQKLGEWAMEGMLDGKTVCESPRGSHALALLTKRLEEASESRFPLSVRVVDSDVINAFALPGGQIVVMNGVISGAGSPDEVAGVLAHEVAHVTRRHGTEGMIRSIGFGVTIGILMGGSAESGAAIGKLGAQLLELSFSREQEREADRVGTEILDRAGISGEGLVQFFTRLMAQEPLALPALFSTHPPSEQRVADLTARTRDTQRFPPALTDKEWTALKDICASPS